MLTPAMLTEGLRLVHAGKLADPSTAPWVCPGRCPIKTLLAEYGEADHCGGDKLLFSHPTRSPRAGRFRYFRMSVSDRLSAEVF